MSRRKAKRLYSQALDSYQQGFIEGTNAVAQSERRKELAALLWPEDDYPARRAGRNAAIRGERIDPRVLPLDVWVRVLAAELRP